MKGATLKAYMEQDYCDTAALFLKGSDIPGMTYTMGRFPITDKLLPALMEMDEADRWRFLLLYISRGMDLELLIENMEEFGRERGTER